MPRRVVQRVRVLVSSSMPTTKGPSLKPELTRIGKEKLGSYGLVRRRPRGSSKKPRVRARVQRKTRDDEWWWTGVVGLADQVDRGKHAGEDKKIALGAGGFRGPN